MEVSGSGHAASTLTTWPNHSGEIKGAGLRPWVRVYEERWDGGPWKRPWKMDWPYPYLMGPTSTPRPLPPRTRSAYFLGKIGNLPYGNFYVSSPSGHHSTVAPTLSPSHHWTRPPQEQDPTARQQDNHTPSIPTAWQNMRPHFVFPNQRGSTNASTKNTTVERPPTATGGGGGNNVRSHVDIVSTKIDRGLRVHGVVKQPVGRGGQGISRRDTSTGQWGQCSYRTNGHSESGSRAAAERPRSLVLAPHLGEKLPGWRIMSPPSVHVHGAPCSYHVRPCASASAVAQSTLSLP